MKFPQAFNVLVDHLKGLPGIGEKTAIRLALYIFHDMDTEKVEAFSQVLKEVKTLQTCKTCGMMMDEECPFCSNELREKDTIMVLESIKDVLVIENSQNYHGLYHITNGIIDFSRGIEPQDLNIDSLFLRTKDIQEIIIAFSGTVMGDLTGNYIKELLKGTNIKVSRIAYGIPVGGELSYADRQTLSKALDNRVILK